VIVAEASGGSQDGQEGAVTGPTSYRTLALLLHYDGTHFHGFAKQPGKRTVEGVLSDALLTVLRDPSLKLSVAGRTDAGVHALGQVVSVRTRSDVETGSLERSLRRLLPDEISVRVIDAPDGFDARRSALSRRYRYRVLTTPHPDPLRRNRVWWVGELSSEGRKILESAASLLVGTHDFKAFCKKSTMSIANTRRTVIDALWMHPLCSCGLCTGELWFEIEAEAFCQQMVRRLVATMVHWATRGLEPVRPDAVDRISVPPAPPSGLYLLSVRYPFSLLEKGGAG
jgi:tRNA pseudouridine38-40 synthase